MALALGMGAGGTMLVLARDRIRKTLDSLTRYGSFDATPDLLAHDPAHERRQVVEASGKGPTENIDAALEALGSMRSLVRRDDIVIIKVSAQWWNQGMTNVAAVRRVIEQVLEVPGFEGEVIVFENTHFRASGGSGLSRAWTHPSERNVDVPAWSTMGDLIPFFAKSKRPVSFVGLIDAGPSSLGGDHWHDHDHAHGTYGGDGRGPIASGETRDGYVWDFDRSFELARSLVGTARTPLSWPVFTAGKTKTVVDLARGAFRREGDRLVRLPGRVFWINMTTVNEHASTGMTGACKSTMGVVDMSCGRMGTHPMIRGYDSVHYFGNPGATWRMAGPLAHFAREVREPDLVLSVAEWIATTPIGAWDPEKADIRLAEASAKRVGVVLAGTDPVAIDAHATRTLLHPNAGQNRAMLDLDDPSSKVSKFLRYYRLVRKKGTIDASLIDVKVAS